MGDLSECFRCASLLTRGRTRPTREVDAGGRDVAEVDAEGREGDGSQEIGTLRDIGTVLRAGNIRESLKLAAGGRGRRGQRRGRRERGCSKLMRTQTQTPEADADAGPGAAQVEGRKGGGSRGGGCPRRSRSRERRLSEAEPKTREEVVRLSHVTRQLAAEWKGIGERKGGLLLSGASVS